MISDPLFRNFAIWACTPNGVANLRKLILQLALSGKFALQNPSDEPANKLLKRIQEELDNRYQRKKKQNGLPIIDLAALTELPESWIWTELSDVCLIRSGNTPKSFNLSVNIGEIPFFKISDMNNPGNEKLLLNSTITINREEALALGIRIQEPGTVVFPKRGGAIATNKKRILAKPSAYDANIMGIRIPIIPPKFLFYWLSSFDLSALSSGSAVPQINHLDFLPLPFPLPPLAEQKRIVAKIDLLMALCDDLEARQQAEKLGCIRFGTSVLIALQNATNAADLTRFWSLVYQQFDSLFDRQENVNMLEKCILQLAMKGELVSQNSNDEPVDRDLKLIEDEKKKLLKARKIVLRDVSESALIEKMKYRIPDNWRWCRLGDVAFFQEGPGIRYWQFRTEGVKLLNVKNLVDGELCLDNTDKYVSEEEFRQKYQHFKIEEGDLLFASSGASWGKLAWFKDPGYPVILNTSTIRLRFFSKRFSKDYLYFFLASDLFREQMEEQLVGMQPNFGSTHLSRTYIPIPPIAEQYRIVTKLRSHKAQLNELRICIQQSRKIQESLSDSVVKQFVAES